MLLEITAAEFRCSRHAADIIGSPSITDSESLVDESSLLDLVDHSDGKILIG
jgi:hypothetical protein